jgi:hypothetical protein
VKRSLVSENSDTTQDRSGKIESDFVPHANPVRVRASMILSRLVAMPDDGRQMPKRAKMVGAAGIEPATFPV